jgi:hypothetical protein
VSKIDEMWSALEAHKPKRKYAEAWATMCKERTKAAAWAADDMARASRARDAAASAASAGYAAMFATDPRDAEEAALADHYAQEAIDAIKRESAGSVYSLADAMLKAREVKP